MIRIAAGSHNHVLTPGRRKPTDNVCKNSLLEGNVAAHRNPAIVLPVAPEFVIANIQRIVVTEMPAADGTTDRIGIVFEFLENFYIHQKTVSRWNDANFSLTSNGLQRRVKLFETASRIVMPGFEDRRTDSRPGFDPAFGHNVVYDSKLLFASDAEIVVQLIADLFHHLKAIQHWDLNRILDLLIDQLRLRLCFRFQKRAATRDATRQQRDDQAELLQIAFN